MLIIVLLPILYLGLNSCEKNGGPPNIDLTVGEGFVAGDTILMVGDSVDVGIEVDWNGINNLKKLEVAVNQDIVSSTEISLDHAQFQITIVKGLADIETWVFTVYDEKGNEAKVSLVLSKDPDSEFGPVAYYNSIRIGAQENLNVPGFFGLEPAASYDLNTAFIQQSHIDLLFYYDETDKSCIASPGANIGNGIYDETKKPGDWTIRNTTRFVKSDLTASDFDGIFHDGVFIVKYDSVNAKRKAKNLAIDDVYIFRTESGLLGAFYVKLVSEGSDGEIELAIKVQAN